MTDPIFISSYDLFVPVRKRFTLQPEALMATLSQLGLDVEIPTSARLDQAEVDYFPATVRRGAKAINTGFTLAAPESWLESARDSDATDDDWDGEDDCDSEADADWIDDEVGSFTIFANNTPSPRDENELPFCWFVAAAIAALGDGVVVDAQADTPPLAAGSKALEQLLERMLADFDFDKSAGQVYPFELFKAIEKGQREVVRSILDDDDSQLEARDANGYTPFLFALRAGQSAIAQALLQRGADISVENRYEMNAVDAALMADDQEMLRLLVSKGVGLITAVQLAGAGEKELCERLLAAGCPIDTATPGGWTPLMVAIYEGHEELALWLVEKGARLDLENQDGATPLMIAADQNHPRLVRDFLVRGADASHRAHDGSTALAWAKRQGFEEVVELLEP
jgi:hypothetical protein